MNHKPFKSRTYRFLSLLHVLNRCGVCNLEQFHPLQAGFHTPNVKLVRDVHFPLESWQTGVKRAFFRHPPARFCPSFIGLGLRHVAAELRCAHMASVLPLIPQLSLRIKAFRGACIIELTSVFGCNRIRYSPVRDAIAVRDRAHEPSEEGPGEEASKALRQLRLHAVGLASTGGFWAGSKSMKT